MIAAMFCSGIIRLCTAHPFNMIQDDTVYHVDRIIPCIDTEAVAHAIPICFHISMFGFSKSCTTKPPPFLETFWELYDEIFKDGFITCGDPIFIQQPAEILDGVRDAEDNVVGPLFPASQPGEKALFCQSLGYVKGMARVTTLLVILHLAWKKGYNLDKSPKLKASVCRIWALNNSHGSKREIALQNLKISSRGSIRKAPNVITILYMVKTLASNGDTDSSSFLKTWNQRASKVHQVVGKKAVSLKMFLDAPDAVCMSIVDFKRAHMENIL